jgi:threonine dehydrogenase-like Zn-dependent dehydrogenase
MSSLPPQPAGALDPGSTGTVGLHESRIARLVGPRRFVLEDQVASDPPPGHIRVRIIACGVCASELHTVQEDLSSYPVELGHEPVGIVEAVGPGVEDLIEGTRVTGGFGPSFADRVVADRRSVVEVPNGLRTEDAIGEPLGCVVEARRRTSVTAGDRIAVVGVGYMGLLMLHVLEVTGAGHVLVVDPRDDARRTALTFGATEAVTPADLASGEADGSADVVIEATGAQQGLDLATRLVREHGVLSILGYHQSQRTVDMQAWNWKAINVVNAHVRRRDLLNDAIRRGLELVRLGRIRPGDLVTHRFGLDRVGEAFGALADKPAGYIKSIVVMEGDAG